MMICDSDANGDDDGPRHDLTHETTIKREPVEKGQSNR